MAFVGAEGACLVADKSKRVDWHRITFWGSIGVASIFIFFASFDRDRRILTIFEAEGRNELSKFVRYNFPDTANWMGLNRNATSPAPLASSR